MRHGAQGDPPRAIVPQTAGLVAAQARMATPDMPERAPHTLSEDTPRRRYGPGRAGIAAPNVPFLAVLWCRGQS